MLNQPLEGLIERVGKATGELPIADALTLWCMSAGCTLVEHKNGECGLDGYWDHHILVDEPGSRKNVIVPEWQLPDRSIDAALGLVERLLPKCGWSINGGIDIHDSATVWLTDGTEIVASSATPVLALILATLRAIQSTETGDAA